MTIQVHCPNGTCLEFPDGTPPEVVDAKVAEFGGDGGPPSLPLETVAGLVQGAAQVAQAITAQLQTLQQTAAQMLDAARVVAGAAQAIDGSARAMASAAQAITDATERLTAAVPEIRVAIADGAVRVESAIMAPADVVRDKGGRVVGSRKKRGA